MSIKDIISKVMESKVWKGRDVFEKLAFFCLLGFGFFSSQSIGFSQIFTGLALIFCFPALLRDEQKLFKNKFLFPILAFILLSFLCVVFSLDPGESLWNARNLLMLIVIPVTIVIIRDEADLRWMLFAIGSGAVVTSFWGLIQVITRTGRGDDGLRLTGILGHYMTAGGILMMVTVMMITVALFAKEKIYRQFAISFAAIAGIATLLTQSRNSYLGLAAALLFVLVKWRKGIIYLLPFILSLVVLLSPPMIRERMYKVVDLEDRSVQTRLYMAKTGMNIIADFPLFGAGLNQIENIYDRFKLPEDPGNVPHLHNNFLQIAAERGIPALLAWLAYIILLYRSLIRIYNNERSSEWLRIAAIGCMGAIIAMVIGGMFEYNFGDSEVLMHFLLVTSLPFGMIFKSRKKVEATE